MKKNNRFWNITSFDEGDLEEDDSKEEQEDNDEDEKHEAGACITFYGPIAEESWFEDTISSKAFAEDLKSLGGRDIVVRINSPGGDVFAAHAIYNQLKGYPGHVTVKIDGMCASSATIVAMAGDTIDMPDNAIFMIHNPKACICEALDEPCLNKLQAELKVVKQTIVNVYTKRCNLSESRIKKMMDDETWMTAEQAKEYGFIDNVSDAMPITNQFINNAAYCKDNYKNYGKMPKINNRNGDDSMNNEEKKSFLNELKGIFSSKSGEEAVKNAVSAERKRITDLLNLRVENNANVEKIINIAISEGNTAEEIKEFVNIAAASAPKVENKGIEEIKNLIKDQLESGAGSIEPNNAITNSANDELLKKKNVDDVVNYMSAMMK